MRSMLAILDLALEYDGADFVCKENAAQVNGSARWGFEARLKVQYATRNSSMGNTMTQANFVSGRQVTQPNSLLPS